MIVKQQVPDIHIYVFKSSFCFLPAVIIDIKTKNGLNFREDQTSNRKKRSSMNLSAPPPLRKASTVILIRERNHDAQVFLLRRSNQSGFMDNLYVFPGGVVEPEDRGFESFAPYVDLSRDEVEKNLGGEGFPWEDAFCFAIAAIRETLEEAGVLMASTQDRDAQDLERICMARLGKNLPSSWFRSRVVEENWILSLSSLRRWSHWVTPESMKKRFDTRFFIAVMPEGQTCMPDNTETQHGIWLSPQKALEQNLSGVTPLAPPTVVTLTQMLEYRNFSDLHEAMSTRPWGNPLAPRLVRSPAGPVIIEPWDPIWPMECGIDATKLADKILPAGSWFSRIWCDNGIWKPVDR